ncbi:class I SAM-dependent methyltransferase [Candidatus Uhrbacteria bacterium]|nr:class I SAM-dependent methyltransferase [Candidatus Uhrbacteria bacterium]
MVRTTPWDRFAKECPTFYIATHTRWRWNEEDTFWRSGERTVQFIWDHVYPRLARRFLAIEIGVGIGRLAVPMAQRFVQVKVVDHSRVMLEQLRLRCARFGRPNITAFLDTAAWDTEPADFIYSALTFQHISELATIEMYVAKIARCLRGVAFLQFDTRPRSSFERWREQLPEQWMPRTWRMGMRRIRRDADVLRTLFARHHLPILEELNPDSALHVFILGAPTPAVPASP